MFGRYSFEAIHFYELLYREGDHSMTIEVDLRDAVPCIYRDAIRQWSAPHGDEAISEAKRDQILRRMRRYLGRKYGSVEVDRGG